jgi:hypothetical protein
MESFEIVAVLDTGRLLCGLSRRLGSIWFCWRLICLYLGPGGGSADH